MVFFPDGAGDFTELTVLKLLWRTAKSVKYTKKNIKRYKNFLSVVFCYVLKLQPFGTELRKTLDKSIRNLVKTLKLSLLLKKWIVF